MRPHIALGQPFGIATHPWHRDANLLPTALPFLIHPQSDSFPHCSGMKNSSWSWSGAKNICNTLRLGRRKHISLWRDISQNPTTCSHLAGAKGIGFYIMYCNQNKENSFSTLEVLPISQTQNSQLTQLKDGLHSACQGMLLQWEHYSSHFPALLHTHCIVLHQLKLEGD